MPALRIPWKVLLVTMAAMLIAGSVAAQETPTPEPLTPVQRRAVRAFAADRILEGTSCSVEDCSGTVQRWEVAMWIIRLFNYQETPPESFADVDSEQPYAGFVETLYDERITVGCPSDPLRFCPERPASRGQMAAFVTRAFDLDDTDPPHGFFDVSPTHVFRDNISALQNAGILSADCNEGERLFCPWQPIAAAEAVEWLYRADLLGPTIGRDNNNGGGGGGFGGGGGGGGFGGGGGTNPPNTNPPNTNPPNTNPPNTNPPNTNPPITNPPITDPSTTDPPTPITLPTFTSNDEIDVANGECTHVDPHGGAGGRQSYAILDGRYPASLVLDDEGPYASVDDKNEFFVYSDSPQNVRYRYRFEPDAIRGVYFAHWHEGTETAWVYWIPERVLVRVEDSVAPVIDHELLFEDKFGNQYRRLRNDRGELRYGPFSVPPQCNDHSHPPATGNHDPNAQGG